MVLSIFIKTFVNTTAIPLDFFPKVFYSVSRAHIILPRTPWECRAIDLSAHQDHYGGAAQVCRSSQSDEKGDYRKHKRRKPAINSSDMAGLSLKKTNRVDVHYL